MYRRTYLDIESVRVRIHVLQSIRIPYSQLFKLPNRHVHIYGTSEPVSEETTPLMSDTTVKPGDNSLHTFHVVIRDSELGGGVGTLVETVGDELRVDIGSHVAHL